MHYQIKQLNNMKKQLFIRAWQLAKELVISFSNALKQAWAEFKGIFTDLNADSLKSLLRNNVGTLSFIKKDGTHSVHLATKIASYVPTELLPKGNASSDKVVTFFSLTVNEWRCISLSSLPTAIFTI